MTRYFLIFSCIYLFCACDSSEDIEPSLYTIYIKNSYFEDLDTLRVEFVLIPKLKKDSISEYISLPKGNYKFSCVTQSNLYIKANLDIQGLAEKIIIKVNFQGNVIME